MRRNHRNVVNSFRRATNEELLGILRGEKLAEFLYKNEGAYCMNQPKCAALLDKGIEIQESACKKCMLEWLQKEAT